MRPTFEEWSQLVWERLNTLDVFEEVLRVSEDLAGQRPTDLQELRGDEPEGAYDGGDSVDEYVRFLRNEWELFGPEGE